MRPMSKTCACAAILALTLLGACGEKIDNQNSSGNAPAPVAMDQAAYETWEIALVEMRIEKNEEFAKAETSPLPEEDVADFVGLNYFLPAAGLKFQVPFTATAGTDTVMLTKRKGNLISYLRRGEVSFSHEGHDYTLPVFGPVDHTQGDYLWLPFTDATTGKTTYGGGRYLDIEVDAQGLVNLDFNYAYNPLCNYNSERYNCTLPPNESHLDFAVEAGEKSYRSEP